MLQGRPHFQEWLTNANQIPFGGGVVKRKNREWCGSGGRGGSEKSWGKEKHDQIYCVKFSRNK